MKSAAALFALAASLATAALIPPSKDPFYTPSGNWQGQAPGTILNSRTIPNAIPNVTYSAAYQLLYRTTDALGNASAAVTTVIIPTTPDFSKLLSYQIVYDTPDVDCSPSYLIQEGGPNAFDNGYTYGLDFGWVVNTADYEGPNAAFTNGPISGYATLDSIRAALNSANLTGLYKNATIAMWGYSGGALASEWAAELQPSYAPELNISGSAMGGLTPNVSSVAVTVNNGPDAGLVAAGLLGIVGAYPNLTSLINSTTFTNSSSESAFLAVKNECITQIGAMDAGVNIFSYFTQGEGILTDPAYQFAINDGGIMGIHGTPAASNKLYFYKSTLDEVSPVADTDALFSKYCSEGVTIQYSRDAYGSHQEEAYNGGPNAIVFLQQIFEGTYSQTGCVEDTHNSANSVISSTSLAPVSYTATNQATTTALSGAVSTTASGSGSSAPTSTSGSGSGVGGGSGSGSGSSSAATTTASSTGPVKSGAAVTMGPKVLAAVGGLAAALVL